MIKMRVGLRTKHLPEVIAQVLTSFSELLDKDSSQNVAQRVEKSKKGTSINHRNRKSKNNSKTQKDER